MDVKVPEVGESIQEALVAEWLKKDGDQVVKNETICELETDKINVELPAEVDGVLHIKVEQGQTVKIGAVIASIEEDTKAKTQTSPPQKQQQPDNKKEKPSSGHVDKSPGEMEGEKSEPKQTSPTEEDKPGSRAINPAARQLARENEIDLDAVSGSGRDGRVTLEDVREAVETKADLDEGESKPERLSPEVVAQDNSEKPITRQAMTPIRERIASRLLEARQQTAMLTTFNEADMSQVKDLRLKHQEHFTAKHGIKLGLMSFFVKATIEALREYPAVNARIDGRDIVYHHYFDIGIAVGTDRGLVVPVLRNADQLTFAEIEQAIADMAEKASTRKLTLADIEGGTFTISNGGIYGSLLSTPILNPPQCGVLGMHAIQERPVVRNGTIVIRPIMNLALSYDHRLIDGREAVGFLKLIKEYIEDPEELLLEL